MFKKLFLVLALVFALVIVPVSGVMAADNGDQCTLKKGMKVIQLMPNKSMRGVTVPKDVAIEIGPEIPAAMVERLNSMGSGMDWTSANMGIIEVDFGRGAEPLMLVVKDSDVDCN